MLHRRAMRQGVSDAITRDICYAGQSWHMWLPNDGLLIRES